MMRAVLGLLGSTVFVFAAGCSAGSGDPPITPNPNPLGSGSRIKDIANPNLPNHPKTGATVDVTGAVHLWIDTFDETNNGKSQGTVYIQDVGSQDPYSGISIYSPSFIPADLRLSPGDVLDFDGPYEELGNIGSATFPVGQVLTQLSKPLGTFRYEYQVPQPRSIDPKDLNDYNIGRQWVSMLVVVQNVTIDKLTDDGKGRVTAHITSNVTQNGAAVSNELYDLKVTDFPPGTTFKSLTGIVTWFYSYHIAPRSPDDIKI